MGHLHKFSKIKSQKSHKIVEIMVFLLFLQDDRRIRIRIRIQTSDKWIRIREAQKHVDPVDPDPDPQQWLWRSILIQLLKVKPAMNANKIML
jgi:hypothetical protein